MTRARRSTAPRLPSGGSDKIRGVPLAAEVLVAYDASLNRQALAPRMRMAYRRWARELVEHLDAGEELAACLRPDVEHDRRAIVTDWRRRSSS